MLFEMHKGGGAVNENRGVKEDGRATLMHLKNRVGKWE